jgi:hypothetical protein
VERGGVGKEKIGDAIPMIIGREQEQQIHASEGGTSTMVLGESLVYIAYIYR